VLKSRRDGTSSVLHRVDARYEIELWGDHKADLEKVFTDDQDERGLNSLHSG